MLDGGEAIAVTFATCADANCVQIKLRALQWLSQEYSTLSRVAKICAVQGCMLLQLHCCVSCCVQTAAVAAAGGSLVQAQLLHGCAWPVAQAIWHQALLQFCNREVLGSLQR
jgi:hypothetical protein